MMNVANFISLFLAKRRKMYSICLQIS